MSLLPKTTNNMNTCGECKYINGVCLMQGFCDKHFHDVRTDRIACKSFANRKKAAEKPATMPVPETTPAPAPVVEPQPVVSQPQPQHTRVTKGKRSHALIKRLSHEEKEYLITSYFEVPVGDLAAHFGVSRMCLLRTLKQLGVKIRKRGQSTKVGKANSVAGVKKYFADKRNHE